MESLLTSLSALSLLPSSVELASPTAQAQSLSQLAVQGGVLQATSEGTANVASPSQGAALAGAQYQGYLSQGFSPAAAVQALFGTGYELMPLQMQEGLVPEAAGFPTANLQSLGALAAYQYQTTGQVPGGTALPASVAPPTKYEFEETPQDELEENLTFAQEIGEDYGVPAIGGQLSLWG